MTARVEVRPGAYQDSVRLMTASEQLTADPAVEHALIAMGTPLNVELLGAQGYALPAVGAADLVIAYRAEPSEHDRIAALIDRILAGPTGDRGRSSSVNEASPRTIRGAGDAVGATVALISVPGPHAFREAIEAIEAGLHPIVFSDNVSVDHERVLKSAASAAGLVAMGPDCGTVVLDGVGLGFANVVAPGPIALVAASGTGAQQVCALADQAGVGVRHVIGVGGRDLSNAIGGPSTIAALGLLDADPSVEVIGLVAKEIGEAIAPAMESTIAALATPVIRISAADLTGGTRELLAAVGASLPAPVRWGAVAPTTGSGSLLGLYSGGTLAGEARALCDRAGVNAEIVDLGDDEHTRGRPHPMIDHRLRLERLEAVRHDSSIGAVVLDVVLGHGAAADPAGALAAAIAELNVPVHVALIGTAGDPQGLEPQAERLVAAGAAVTLSNAEAVQSALAGLEVR